MASWIFSTYDGGAGSPVVTSDGAYQPSAITLWGMVGFSLPYRDDYESAGIGSLCT